MHLTEAIALAESVVVDGFDAHRGALDALLAAAAGHGVSATLVDVVADRSAPEVVRQRALGRVVGELARPRAASAPTRPPVVAVAA